MLRHTAGRMKAVKIQASTGDRWDTQVPGNILNLEWIFHCFISLGKWISSPCHSQLNGAKKAVVHNTYASYIDICCIWGWGWVVVVMCGRVCMHQVCIYSKQRFFGFVCVYTTLTHTAIGRCDTPLTSKRNTEMFVLSLTSRMYRHYTRTSYIMHIRWTKSVRFPDRNLVNVS